MIVKHPSYLFTTTFPAFSGCWSPSQLSVGTGGVTPWTSPQFIATKKETTVHTHTCSQFRVPKSPDMHVFGLWETARVARENPHSLKKNM